MSQYSDSVNYFDLFREVCASLGEPITMAVDTVRVVPKPDIPVDRMMAEKMLSELTDDEWDATSIFFILEPESLEIYLNTSVWQAFGSPPTLSILMVILSDSLESAGFFRELPGVAVPDVPTGVRTQVQPIRPIGEALAAYDDTFIFRMVSLLVGRLGFSQPDLEEALVEALKNAG